MANPLFLPCMSEALPYHLQWRYVWQGGLDHWGFLRDWRGDFPLICPIWDLGCFELIFLLWVLLPYLIIFVLHMYILLLFSLTKVLDLDGNLISCREAKQNCHLYICPFNFTHWVPSYELTNFIKDNCVHGVKLYSLSVSDHLHLYTILPCFVSKVWTSGWVRFCGIGWALDKFGFCLPRFIYDQFGCLLLKCYR